MPIISKLSIKHSKIIIAIILILAIFFIFVTNFSKFDNSVNVWFSENNPAFLSYKDIVEAFGSDNSFYIIYRDIQLVSPQGLNTNLKITNNIQKINNVLSVTSLSNASTLKRVDFMVSKAKVIPEVVSDYEALRNSVIKDPMLVNNIISTDAEKTIISIKLENYSDQNKLSSVELIKNNLQVNFPDIKFYFAGLVPFTVGFDQTSSDESRMFLSINIIIIALLTWFLMKSWLSTSLVIIICSISAIITMGIYILTENSVNMVSGIIPVIILVVGVSDSIHVLSKYRDLLITHSNKAALELAIKKTYLPCFYTSITTSAAFLAFTISGVPPISSFGLYTAIGVMVAFFLTFSLLPAIITLSKNHNKNKAALPKPQQKFTYFNATASFIARYKIVIFILPFIIGLISIKGIQQIEYQNDRLLELNEHHPVRQAVTTADDWFGGVFPIDILVQNIDETNMDTLDVINTLDVVHNQLLNMKHVSLVTSPLNIVSRVNSELTGNTHFNIGQFDTAILTKVLKSDSQYNRQHISPDLKKIRIHIRTQWLSNEELSLLLEKIKIEIIPIFNNSGLTTRITGQSVLNLDVNNKLIHTQIQSITLTFILVFILLFIFFKDLKLSIIGLIPSLLPIVTILGIFGFMDIKMDVVTILIASVSLGIGIDNTIHLLSSFKAHMKEDKDSYIATNKAMKGVFKPILLTTIVLLCGFSVLLLSEFSPLIYFGIFFTLAVFLSFIYDFLLLPAILMLLKWPKLCR